MFDRLFERFGPRYVVVMLLATRVCGSIGGVLVVYYVNLTVTLPEPTRTRFIVACAVVVVVAVILSLILAAWETRHLNLVLRQLFTGQTPDPQTAVRAGEEAVAFPARHHRTAAADIRWIRRTLAQAGSFVSDLHRQEQQHRKRGSSEGHGDRTFVHRAAGGARSVPSAGARNRARFGRGWGIDYRKPVARHRI